MASRGFTLLETVVSSMLLSIVISAATALMFVTARALPVDRDPAVTAAETLRAFDLLDSELAFATRITAAEATRIEFAIRDRDADGLEDVISYQWSGVSGEPWTRTVGNRLPDPIVGAVHSLDIVCTLSEDAARIICVNVRVHPLGSRKSLMCATVRLINQPAAP
jgi:prepilin-type N-terminal cleavage/methylation domain-containing protein